ncbi:hypothetical protein HLB23_03765 [Nocardia uniformis]|uniref:Uncharacterized protein n=1 Tax=Nocardia uniformis TaxID=53432 RepID=A0A849BV91_9NOCA|nr:hypothetical protein [Nocardia uniformis]NNH68998.1 hypothetical protein [Nocardia uniformis]
MVTAIVTFLSGLGLGGVVVWALVSYTALNPTPSVTPQECWTVESIKARIERECLRERLEANRSAQAGDSVRCG